MGYAALSFPNNGTMYVGSVIYDIVRVVTGQITTTSQLTFATAGSSEIVNTLGQNWDLHLPATMPLSTATSSLTAFILKATCVNTAKTKYVRLIGQDSGSPPNVPTTDSAASKYGGTTAHIAMHSVTAATATSSFSNGGLIPYDDKSKLKGPIIYLSWSKRHLLIMSSSSTTTTELAATGCFEYTETPINVYRNNVPFSHLHVPLSSSASVFGSTTLNTGSASVNGTIYGLFQLFDYFLPSTGTAFGVYNPLVNGTQLNTITESNGTATTRPSVSTITSTGASAVYMQPLQLAQYTSGVPLMDISSLADVYRVMPGLGAPGDTFTAGGNTYMYFPIGGAGSYALAVRRN